MLFLISLKKSAKVPQAGCHVRASNVIKTWCLILQVVQVIVNPLERNWRFFHVTPSQPTYLSISNFSLIVLLLLSIPTPMLRFAFICIWLVFVNQGTTWQVSPLKCDEHHEDLISAALSAPPRTESFREKRADEAQFPAEEWLVIEPKTNLGRGHILCWLQ